MNRSIPGTEAAEGREFLYIETRQEETFKQLISNVLLAQTEIPMPSAGGIIEERVQITLEDGRSLIGVSYKGDIGGWRARIIGYCELTNRIFGFVSGPLLILSTNAKYPLADLTIHML